MNSILKNIHSTKCQNTLLNGSAHQHYMKLLYFSNSYTSTYIKVISKYFCKNRKIMNYTMRVHFENLPLNQKPKCPDNWIYHMHIMIHNSFSVIHIHPQISKSSIVRTKISFFTLKNIWASIINNIQSQSRKYSAFHIAYLWYINPLQFLVEVPIFCTFTMATLEPILNEFQPVLKPKSAKRLKPPPQLVHHTKSQKLKWRFEQLFRFHRNTAVNLTQHST